MVARGEVSERTVKKIRGFGGTIPSYNENKSEMTSTAQGIYPII